MKPSPAFTNNPASKAPNAKLPSMNNSVRRRLDAQFGINPMTEANKGERYLFELMKAAKFSSPTNPITNPNAKLIINT